jgi:hypothetical protein
MKPTIVGSACQRVQAAIDEALVEGTLSLPPELSAHAARCARCGAEVTSTEQLLSRLRGAAACVGLAQVPRVVDYVMAHTAAEPQVTQSARTRQTKRPNLYWALGQVAAVAAVLAVTVSGLTYVALKVNQAVSGVKPGEVMQHLTAPFNESNRANVKGAK